MLVVTFDTPQDGPSGSAVIDLVGAVQRTVDAWDAEGYRMELETLVVPRRYEAAAGSVRRAMGDDPAGAPGLVVVLDLAPTESEYLIENLAANLIDDPRPDAAGVAHQGRLIDPDGPVAYRSRLPIDGVWDKLLVERVPVRMSHKAGLHVFNETLYRIHRHIQLAGLPTRAGGIRVPGLEAPASDAVDADAQAGGDAGAAVGVGQAQGQAPTGPQAPNAGQAREAGEAGEAREANPEPGEDSPTDAPSTRRQEDVDDEVAMVLGVIARLAEAGR